MYRKIYSFQFSQMLAEIFFFLFFQRFFKYLCIAAKVKKAVEIAKEAVNNGKVGE